jgi:hypothetical protein
MADGGKLAQAGPPSRRQRSCPRVARFAAEPHPRSRHNEVEARDFSPAKKMRGLPRFLSRRFTRAMYSVFS